MKKFMNKLLTRQFSSSNPKKDANWDPKTTYRLFASDEFKESFKTKTFCKDKFIQKFGIPDENDTTSKVLLLDHIIMDLAAVIFCVRDGLNDVVELVKMLTQVDLLKTFNSIRIPNSR